MNTKDDIYIMLGRAVDASTDLAHLSINRGKEIERLKTILSYARVLTNNACLGMSDDDRHKGALNYLADAIAAYDACDGDGGGS